METSWLAPSILSADFSRLGDEIRNVLEAGGDIIHFDVMDNHYVPNLTFGPMVLKSIRNYGITSIIDVHLMVSPVDDLIVQFSDAGADFITIHPESTNHLHRSLNLIKSCGCKVGLGINPATSLNILEYVMDQLDIILLMSVNPGFSGQNFIPSTFKKLLQVRKLIDNSHKNVLLEVDGGINLDNLKEIASFGVNIFVVGSAIFKAKNYKKIINDMRHKLN
ncbi:ribulose-phosphate 3-epimerase [Buchnera aphidicola]|uniref:Ribulose-phosphate 3-epimerase n=1 Tax=Buchnera aphidicola subsp. Melaphis rhois TaxID=118103 RepID=A0A4D6YCW4_BUCMH|nr:ribulose-phosphate 3-epimerase [Buchnera aphidicola]QCI23490.1 ribulose-phosphate 3-epimerase [Buchnera aphidicola (Melaphis rhois)]